MRKKLEASKDNAFLSRMLGEIFCEVPVDIDFSHYTVKTADRAACVRLMVCA